MSGHIQRNKEESNITLSAQVRFVRSERLQNTLVDTEEFHLHDWIYQKREHVK